MPSFDAVSEVDSHELTNAVDQAGREVDNRYDFRGSDCRFTRDDLTVKLDGGSEFQVEQMLDILYKSLAKRGIDLTAVETADPQPSGKRVLQSVKVKQGIDKDTARKIVKLIKDSKLKVQAAIQGEQVRVTGKKRDDLQDVIALLKEAKLGLPLQFVNFRD